ncbi:hypothetical protein ACVWXQ_006818 [Bradyrhizobium sp. S3.14.4]
MGAVLSTSSWPGLSRPSTFLGGRESPWMAGTGPGMTAERPLPIPQSALAFPAGWSITPSDPNEIRSFPADGPVATGKIVQNRAPRPDRAGRLRMSARRPALRKGPGPGQAASGGTPGHAAGRASGCPAGRARLLGPAAAAGAARPVAPDRDPLPDRDRLSAVQLHRRRRQSGRLQRRSRPRAVRGDQGHLHGADAPLRDPGRRALLQPGAMPSSPRWR